MTATVLSLQQPWGQPGPTTSEYTELWRGAEGASEEGVTLGELLRALEPVGSWERFVDTGVTTAGSRKRYVD